MSDTILITGQSLAAEAVDLIQTAGLTPAYVPPYSTGEALIAAVRDSNPVGIISRMGRVDTQVLEAAPRLRVISKHGVGVDNIDLKAAGARGIPVLVATGANAVAVAEHTMALLFAVVKKIPTLDAGLRAGRWEKPGFDGRELAGSSIGLVGFGAIARQTARFAKAFALDVFAYDPFCPDQFFAEEGVTRVADVDDLIASCDIISLHTPLTDQTRNLINADRLARMKPGAIIINTARGGLIDEAALSAALAEGRIAGAGLDSFAQEPPAHDHPFWAEPRLVLTPHIGGVTAASNARVGVQAAQGILDLLAGRDIPASRIVNRDLLVPPAISA
ncbi:MAG: hydroxyacid dehydrogenase [Paracoccus sp. (in: a-proteobacteria)]|uniref:hydroxyacid dehydrogenase n=1 Tax=Paracoccus sp. TaxID=267 RepID=UPI0026DEE2F3|nr:hydroxyacid dehydrogenase [Paracoccus sp. (in: a-proteobacteria)]MDO5631614.1 hydroxyacid dehydrogenase [Paracoccus sp. (in: a-proteobacteria)]